MTRYSEAICFYRAGNEAVFSLESASDYARNDRSAAWGIRCIVVGYEPQAELNAILRLERELALIGGMCAASLMKKDLTPPSHEGMITHL